VNDIANEKMRKKSSKSLKTVISGETKMCEYRQQFLRDREIGTRDAKQGVIINDENDVEKQY